MDDKGSKNYMVCICTQKERRFSVCEDHKVEAKWWKSETLANESMGGPRCMGTERWRDQVRNRKDWRPGERKDTICRETLSGGNEA